MVKYQSNTFYINFERCHNCDLYVEYIPRHVLVAAKRQRHLEHTKGFASVMKCLTNYNKPIVRHNMLLDLAYLYQQFIGYFLPSLDEFHEQVNQVLGQVFFKK